jgi:hypothetical protein
MKIDWEESKRMIETTHRESSHIGFSLGTMFMGLGSFALFRILRDLVGLDEDIVFVVVLLVLLGVGLLSGYQGFRKS